MLRIEDTDLEISKRSCCSSRGLVLIVMKVFTSSSCASFSTLVV